MAPKALVVADNNCAVLLGLFVDNRYLAAVGSVVVVVVDTVFVTVWYSATVQVHDAVVVASAV
jgi:hypothetical protein